ncbi:hypothetical protein BF49_6824 [Bradyrhizobium sp.]|nr:hypothetical protein BF49_6824 [Bradyrhizobium sp.]
MIYLTGSIGEHCVDIGRFEIRIVLKDALARLSGGQQPQDVSDSYAQIANARASMHALRINRNPCQ